MHKSFFRRPQVVVTIAFVVLFVVCDFVAGALVLDRIAVTPHMYYHHALKQDFSGAVRWGSAVYPVVTDNLRLRNDKPRHVPPAGPHRRLLFLGDSFTEGVGVAYEQTYVAHVAERIRQSGDDTEIFNGGVISHSPRLYLLHLQDLMERQGVTFDDIVVFIDVSDIQDELVYEDFTPGRITPALVLRYVKQFAEQNSLTANVLLTRLPLLLPYVDALRSWVGARSAPPAAVPAAAQNNAPLPADATRPPRAVWDNPDHYKIRDAWIDDDDAFRIWGAYGLKLARENLKRLAGYAASKGMNISFAIYPWPRRVANPDNRGRLLWLKIAAEENWTLVDLYPDFAARADAARLYIPGDVHWNAEGHRFAAERWLVKYCGLRHATWCGRLAR